MDRIEWMVEKTTETGSGEITSLDYRFSERKRPRVDRLKKIVIVTMKQSRKAWKPVVHSIMSFQDLINQQREGGLYTAHCYMGVVGKDFLSEIRQANDRQDIAMLVGPESDFSMDEVKQALEKEFPSVSLGQNRLRVETTRLMSIVTSRAVKRVL